MQHPHVTTSAEPAIASERGFTLIELLVVITIIVLLLALLTPALDRAVTAAEAVKCATNLRAVGHGLTLWLMDHKRRYPEIAYFGQLFGNRPDEGAGFSGSNGARDVDDRPLNAYLGYRGVGTRVPLAECPSDQGDPWNNVEAVHCYTEYGTSYIEQWNWDQPGTGNSWFRIHEVFGIPNDSARPSISQRRINRTANKVLVSDWPIYGDRVLTAPQTQWHSADRRLFNTLMADAHVELFDYPVEEMEELPAGRAGNATRPADPSFLWW